jgi:hypothetical protein
MNPPSPWRPPVTREASLPQARVRVRAIPSDPRSGPARNRRLQPSSSYVPPSALRWLTYLLLLPAFAVQAWWAPLQAAGDGLPDSLPADCPCVVCPANCCRIAEESRPFSEPLSLPTSRVLMVDESAPLLAGTSFLPLSSSSDLDLGRFPVLPACSKPGRVPLFLRIRTLRI